MPSTPGLLTALSVSLALSVLLNRRLIRFCHSRGILDPPGKHKRHSVPTPNIGGVSVFVSVGVALTLALAIQGIEIISRQWLSVAVGGLLIFLVGLRDDIRPVSAWLKLAAQAAAGVGLYWGGLVVDPLYVPLAGEVHLGAWAVLINIFWVTLLSNAINLIDGLDGLAAGVSLIGAISLSAITVLLNVSEVTLGCVALAGALIGVLYYNLYPARLYLGDSGSLLIGYLFAVFSLLAPIKSTTAAALLPSILALGAPIAETLISFFRRLLAGKSVLKADRKHLFHYLRRIGLGPRATVRAFWAVGAICGAGAIAMLYSEKSLAVLILVALAVAVFGAILILALRLRRVPQAHGGPNETDHHV
ncbi:MAG: glycosyltransferase family 4 protein [Candidatus Zixiibacteriota bacterium]